MDYLLLLAAAVAGFVVCLLLKFFIPDDDYSFKGTFTVYEGGGRKKRPKDWIKLVFQNPQSGEKGTLTFENFLSEKIRIDFGGRSPFSKDVFDVPACGEQGAGSSGPLPLECEDPGEGTKKFKFKVLIDDGSGRYPTELDPGVKVRRG